tara:strand:+ start:79 stop:252 length:174 start_codon:yes stop_codon:yes gene_type:complete
VFDLHDNQALVDTLFENIPSLYQLDRDEMITVALRFCCQKENLDKLIEHFKEEQYGE